MYAYAGGPAFPTATYWRQPNYWADLVFVPGTTSSPGGVGDGGAGLFPDSSGPTTSASPDRSAVEVGERFQTSTAGQVTALRYFKAPGSPPGTKSGHLWDPNGTLLAAVDFTNESDSGWQEATLDQPVQLTAGVMYVVSYFAPNGGYSATQDYFANGPVLSSPLSAPAIGNGVYRYATTPSFPTQTYWRTPNYWADLVFKPSSPGAGGAGSSPPPVTLPPVTLPPVTLPPVTLPPVTLPPVTLPPITLPPAQGSGITNCAPNPHACGYPDATNTGVPAGTALQAVPETLTSGPGWHWESGGWLQVDAPNAVIDGLDVHGTVDVCEECSGTVIQNSRVTADGSFGIIVRYSYKFGYGATGITIADTEVRGGSQGNGAAITAQNGLPVTITRVNVHNTGTAIQLDRGSITDSYLWDLHVVPNGTHVNGITSNAGSGGVGLTIRHNTVFNALSQTDAIGLFQDFGVQSNVTIDDNLVAGGGYTIYGGAGDRGSTANISITNNRISRLYFPLGGYWGWITHFTPTDPGNVLSGNVWDDTGAPVGA